MSAIFYRRMCQGIVSTSQDCTRSYKTSVLPRPISRYYEILWVVVRVCVLASRKSAPKGAQAILFKARDAMLQPAVVGYEAI